MTAVQAITYVEIDIDFCGLRFGETNGLGTCPAEISDDVPAKCFNTRKTCVVREAYENTPVTLRFSTNADYRDRSIEAIPSLRDFDLSPAIISLGENLGQRASLKVSFVEEPHSDTGPGFDPYRAERPYDAYSQGSFWSKFRARQPYLRGRPLRLIQGIAGQTLEEMETRLFVIESFDGPGPDGIYTITAKDVLKLADGDRAVAPMPSRGTLSGDINSSQTSATLAPTGIGNSEYPASGWIAIGGKEIVNFTRSGDTLTLTRAQYNTTGVAHSAGERCQVCLRYQAEDPADVIEELLTTYAGVDAAEIPIDDWQNETAQFYRRVVTALIPEPTSVRTLMAELAEQCGLAIWWNDVTQQIRLQVVRPIATDAELFDDSKIIRGSLRVTEQPTKRITRVLTYFGQINPLRGVTDPDNFLSQQLTVDTEAEDDDGVSIKKIFSRWIPFGGVTIARRVNDILLSRYRDPPRKISFKLFRYDTSVSPEMGEGCRISNRVLQDATGARESVPVQITRVNPGRDYWEIEAEELSVTVDDEDPNARPIVIDSDIYNINLRTLHDTLYPAPLGKEVVTVTVNTGVIVGSTNPGVPAFNIGSWPTQAGTGTRTSGSAVITALNVDATALLVAGMIVTGTGIPAGTRIASVDSATQITLDKNATSSGTAGALTISTVQIRLINNGKIRGAGGIGGTGASGDNAYGTAGQPGGTGLYTRYPMALDMSGDIGGGGGGGGGMGADNIGPFGPQVDGAGGGGGAGRYAGAGGPGAAGGGYYGSLDAGGPRRFVPYGWSSGEGGAPGQIGADANGFGAAPGGAAGWAIDGWSHVIAGLVTGLYYGTRGN